MMVAERLRQLLRLPFDVAAPCRTAAPFVGLRTPCHDLAGSTHAVPAAGSAATAASPVVWLPRASPEQAAEPTGLKIVRAIVAGERNPKELATMGGHTRKAIEEDHPGNAALYSLSTCSP